MCTLPSCQLLPNAPPLHFSCIKFKLGKQRFSHRKHIKAFDCVAENSLLIKLNVHTHKHVRAHTHSSMLLFFSQTEEDDTTCDPPSNSCSSYIRVKSDICAFIMCHFGLTFSFLNWYGYRSKKRLKKVAIQ